MNCCAPAELRLYRKFVAEVSHLLLHLIDLSDLVYSSPIVQLLMWLPAPKRVHKGHISFCTLSFLDTCFTTWTPVYTGMLSCLSYQHRCHAQKVHLLTLCCRTAWNQMKTAFEKLDARVSPCISVPWKVDGIVHSIAEASLYLTWWNHWQFLAGLTRLDVFLAPIPHFGLPVTEER